MKKWGLLLPLICLLMTGPAGAQDPGPDSFGLYFDLPTSDCFVLNEATMPPGTIIEVHMVIAGANGPIWGLEVAMEDTDTSGLVFWLNTVFAITLVDIAPEPNVIIAGFAEPVVPSSCGHAYIGTVILFSATLVGFEILAGPTVPSSLPNVAAYLDENYEIIPLNFSTNALGNGVNSSGWLRPGYGLCAVNMDAAVAIESTSWSNLKAQYR